MRMSEDWSFSKDISGMMDNETWMSANVAVKEGFANGVSIKMNLSGREHERVRLNRLQIANGTGDSIKQMVRCIKNQANR